MRRRVAGGTRRGVGLRRRASPTASASATCSSAWRREAEAAGALKDADSPLASPRRARSASRGRTARADPASHRRRGAVRCARRVRRARSPPAGGAAGAALARDPAAAGGHPRASGRCPRRSRRCAAASRVAGAARAQPVRRPRGRARLAPRSSGRSRRRGGPARGHRRRSGIGKTRLASELGRAAHVDGRGGAPRPLSRGGADLLPAVRRGVRSLRRGGAAGGAARPGRHATEASSPGSFPSSPGDSRACPSRPSATRRASASGCSRPPARLLANASRSWPVVLVLEDLHWADKPTALLLAHVVRSIQAERVLVIGTYRETELGEPLVSVLADLRRDRAVERLRLGSLHRGEVATMISAWLGRTPPTHFAHALHRETEGNPFFIEEVLRHLIEVAAVDATEWRRLASFTELGIPDGVREAIERRLATLSPATRRIVTMAAAIGRSFSIELLEALAELPRRACARRARGGHGAPDRRRGTRCSEALRVRPRADSRDALRVTERAAPGGAAPPDRRDPRAAARRATPIRLSASSRTTSSRPPSPDGGQGRRLLGPRGAAGASGARVRGGRRALRPRAEGPEAVRARPTPRPAATLLLGLGEAHSKASEFDAEPRRLPGRRRSGANGRPRRAPRARGARPRPWLDRAGHRRPRDHRRARGGARRAARRRQRSPRKAARATRDGASLLQPAGSLPGARSTGRGGGPAAG